MHVLKYAAARRARSDGRIGGGEAHIRQIFRLDKPLSAEAIFSSET